jgi:TolA-binding protein
MRSELGLLNDQLEEVAAEMPEKPDAMLLLRLARGYEARKEDEKALDFYRRAKEASPDSLHCISELAQAYDRQRGYDKAVEEYFALMAKLPEQADPESLQRHIIWLAVDRWRNVPKAREFAHQFAKSCPGPGWERTLGDLYKDQQPPDNAKALEHYRNYMGYAGKADIDVWQGGVSQWDLLNRLGQYDDAVAYAKAWREQFPNDPRSLEMIYLTGQTYRNQGKMAEAAKVFQEVIGEYPGSYAAFLCATTAVDAFTPDMRDGIVKKWFELNPGDTRAAEIYFKLGQRYEPEQGGIPQAIAAYQVVWENFRDKWNENVRAADRLSYLLFVTGKVDEGAQVAKDILAKFGNQGHQEVLNAWYRLLDYYGPRVPFRAEVDTTLSTGTTPWRITDGATDGGNANPANSWLSDVSPREHWVDCVLYKPAKVHRVHIFWGHAEELPKAYKLQYKQGENYADIPGFEQWREAKDAAEELGFAPVATDRIRVLQAGSGGAVARVNQMVVAEIQLFAILTDEAVEQYKRFAAEMAQAFPNRAEAFYARQHFANFFYLHGEHLQANIETQKLVYLSPHNDTWHWDSIVGLARSKARQARHGEAAAIFRTLLKVNVGFSDKARITSAEKSLGEALTASGSGVLVIDPNAPEAGLLWGNAFALSGEEQLAWQRYVENAEIFRDHQHKLSAEYLRLIVQRLLAAKEIKTAVETCAAFLAHRGEDKMVSASDKAKMTLLLGDCYYRDERYEIAREHYFAAATQYAKIPEGIEAQFKIVTVFIAQKVFEKAQEILEDLLKSKDPETAIRAHIMKGILYHQMGEKKAAVDEFRGVLIMSPGAETADEIIFRLGTVYHEQGRYKEAVDTLKLIGAWSGETRSVVEIGGEMRIRVSDRDLTMSRGSAEVPVIVQVVGPDGAKRDRERVLLSKSEAGAGLFVGSIMTKLGEPAPDDRVLQVGGADVISYHYDPDFAKDFIIEEGERKEFALRVASTGDLVAKSAEIKEEEEVRVEVDAGAFGKKEKKVTDFRDETQVKPGNNIYFQVEDLDLDKTSNPDTVTVEVAASSGDVVQAKLEETGGHTGKFKGQVGTGFRPPDAMASDFSEGHDAVYAIDGDPDPQKCWMGLMDGQAPKWLQIDLKEVFPLDKVVWHRGKGAKDREPIRYLIQLSEDNKQWQTVATFPEDWNYHDRLIYGPLMVRTMPNYIGDPQDLRAIMDMCELAPRDYGEGRIEWINEDKGNPFGPDEYYIAVFWGNFYCPETGTYEFAVDSDDAAFMLVDGELVAEFPGNHAAANNWTHSGKMYLKKGVHKMTYYFQEWEIIQIAKAAWKLPSKAEFEVIPQDYFDPGKYPDLAKKEKLAKRKFNVKESQDGYGATLTFEPRNARFVRMLIEEFHSDAPAIALFEVWTGEKRVVPSPGTDILALARNGTLELTPGDTITASYTDEVNVEPGTPVVIRQDMHVTFFNGHVAALTRQFIEDERTGERKKADLLTARVNAGDPLVVRIVDYDEDISDGVDKVKFLVRTLVSEKTYEFTAKETEPYSGVFEAEVPTSTEAKAGTVVLVAGDTMEIAYLDRENTEPGHPTERNWKVIDNQASQAKLRIVPFGGDIKGEEKWETKLRLISLEEGLTVEVMDPDKCLHEGSVIRVKLEGSIGKDTAIVECKVAGAGTGGVSATGAPAEQLIAALSEGLFRGHMKTLLGDSTSPDFIIQAAGMFDEETVRKVKSPKGKKGSEEEPEIPVLNISGQDVISVTYVDEQSPDNPLATDVTTTARILSNGTIGIFDDTYEEEIDIVHIGENVFLQVTDYDADTSAEHDFVQVDVQTSAGDTLTAKLKETLSHSGVFSIGIPLEHSLKPKPGDERLEADYGSRLTVRYLDERNTEAEGPVARAAEADVIAGTDGVVAAFSKKYPSDDVAVETEFKIGECFYFLGKEHMNMKKAELAQREIREGRQVLRDVLTYYPNSPLIDQAAFMLGNLDMEDKRYDDAIVTYRRITRDHADSPIAPDAQFATGRAYEMKGEFDKACEEYVKLAYKYPESAQLPEAMIRIGLYFFEKKQYKTAISVFKRFIERYPDDENTQKVYFKMGLAYILNENFVEGAEHFKTFVDKFPASSLTAAALYWAGDAYLKGHDALHAYQMFKRCVWEYGDTKWAKFSRGRLTSPVFDRIAEME